MQRIGSCLVGVAGWLVAFAMLSAGGDCAEAQVVCNVKVLSDKVMDVSSLEAWREAAMKPGMTGEQKAIAAWDAVVRFRHHDADAHEYLGMTDDICHDAIKIFNSYGYCFGRGAQMAIKQLARSAGMPARGQSLNRWLTSEIFYDDSWHCLDPGMIFYFRNAGGAIAGVEEIAPGVKAWYDANPGYLGDDTKVREFLKTQGSAKGPAILTKCPTMNERGDFPLNYFAWYTAMLIFDGSNQTPFVYEEASTRGHRVNVRLHRGETFVRRWANDGHHVDEDLGRKPECLAGEVGKGPLYYTPKLGDLAPGRIGAGRIEYVVPLDAALAGAAVSFENLQAVGGSLKQKDAAKPGVLVLDRSCGYVYLRGELQMAGKGGLAVEVSDTNGLQWKEIAKADGGEAKVDLTPHILRRYDYRLRLTLTGGAAVERMSVAEDVQCSQRALPALDAGANTITFSAGPQESTVTVEGAGLKFKGRQPTYEDLGCRLDKIDANTLGRAGIFVPAGPDATVTYPVETPGDMVRLRIDCNYRANDANETWEYEVSLDDGRTWKQVGRAAGPVRQSSEGAAFTDIPAGTRKALVRFRGTQRSSLIIFGSRIDADYREAAGGFSPVEITYEWEENGAQKRDVHVAKSASETYAITCGPKPRMRSVSLRLVE